MSSYVTKNHLFGAQRALLQEQQAMIERIDNLATDLRLSEQRTRDYFDTSMSSLKEDIRTMMVRSSTTSSSSRWSHSSRHSDDTIFGSSTPTSNTLCRATHQDRQENRNPLHDNDSQEQACVQEHRHRQNQATFAQAQERQRQRQQVEEERAQKHQDAQDAEAQRQEQQLREAQALEAQRAL